MRSWAQEKPPNLFSSSCIASTTGRRVSVPLFSLRILATTSGDLLLTRKHQDAAGSPHACTTAATPFPLMSATHAADHHDSTLIVIIPSIALSPTQPCPNTSPPLLQHSSLEAEIPPPNREKRYR
ncbi:uncharacterized protein LOC122050453 [Zingiber officinale]|uniref:uncharacterized protein LOC122050453 n=1 Tax=Zingiber officinale TaxID=94328 RepID=UPI001C4BF9FB|nr:uncharacterized protein LOC122050453 [Zingiber officinale]